jgi:predicted phage tail protein
VRRVVRGEMYARARLVNGALFAVLGTVVIVRTLATVRLGWQVLPACGFGAAMIGLGASRYWGYFSARAQR